MDEENVTHAFNVIWEKEKNRYRTLLWEKRKRKVDFLRQKFGKRKEQVVTKIAGITVADQLIPQNFSSSPRCYGNIEVTKNEVEILSLPPKFAVFDRVDLVKCEAQVEKGLAKLRWTTQRTTEPANEQGESTTQKTIEMGEQHDEVRVFNEETKTLDLRLLKPSDLPFNKRVVLPAPLDDEKEVTLQHLRDRLSKTTKKYVQSTEYRTTVNGNLTKAEKSGLKSLKERIDQDGIVVYQTDKSGRFSVDAIHNYREACQTHTENDPTVDQDFHEKVQKQANAHSTFWVRILRTGEELGGQARIKGNMLVQDCILPPLYALRKDHKHIVNPVNGPPVRPICGAVSAYNRKLSYLMSFILNEVWKEAESVCMNTEEMLADFKRFNVDHITEDIIVGSADVKALYPSLDVTFTVEKVCEIFYSSSVKVIGIDTEELGLYLALNKTEAELADLDILCFCPTRKTNRGRPPTITGCAIDNNKDKRIGPWLPPKEEPDEQTTRRMFTIAMKVTLLFIMENHMYTFKSI